MFSLCGYKPKILAVTMGICRWRKKIKRRFFEKSIPFLSGFILFGMVLSVSYAQTLRGTGTTNLTIN